MTTITTPFRRSPRSVRTSFAPASKWGRQTLNHLRMVGESLHSDDRARLCDVTLASYSEARSAR